MFLEWRGRVGRVLNRKIVQFAFGSKDGTASQIPGNRFCIEGRGHYDQPLARQSSQERESQVGIEMAFVEFIQDHRADTSKSGIG